MSKKTKKQNDSSDEHLDSTGAIIDDEYEDNPVISVDLENVPANAPERSALERLTDLLGNIETSSSLSLSTRDDMMLQVESYSSIRDGLASIFAQLDVMEAQKILIDKEVQAHTSYINRWYYRARRAEEFLHELSPKKDDYDKVSTLLIIAKENYEKFLRERKILRARGRVTSNVIKQAQVAQTTFLSTVLSGYSTSSVAIMHLSSHTDIEDYRDKIREITKSVQSLKAHTIDPTKSAMHSIEA